MLSTHLDVDTELVARALLRALASHGPRTPTLKTVAAEAHAGTSSVHRWLGGKDSIPRVIEGCAALSWRRLSDNVAVDGWAGYLPSNADGVYWLRGWLAVEAIARSEAGCVQTVRDFWAEVSHWMNSMRRDPLPSDELRRREVLLRGLWSWIGSFDPERDAAELRETLARAHELWALATRPGAAASAA
ncbi:MAG: hypothetical protein J2O46_03280 [Nocardioides sp.]|nr:hypothetical protein [Nocardioides sp.]